MLAHHEGLHDDACRSEGFSPQQPAVVDLLLHVTGQRQRRLLHVMVDVGSRPCDGHAQHCNTSVHSGVHYDTTVIEVDV